MPEVGIGVLDLMARIALIIIGSNVEIQLAIDDTKSLKLVALFPALRVDDFPVSLSIDSVGSIFFSDGGLLIRYLIPIKCMVYE